MGILAVDSIRSRTVAPVTVSDDLNVTGVSTVGVLTATSVVVGSAVTVNADGVITSGIVTATTFQGNFNGTTGTFSGDVSIGGTLTYEDVERVDATGLSTFREGLNVGSPTGVGGTFNPQGDISAGIGSFSGAISGTTGTFTGAISGTTGTFTGDVDVADKIIHTGDTNTSIRFPSADTFTVETGGSERLRINSVGITSVQGQDDQDNFIVNCSGTEFAVHTDTTDGEVSLRAQDGTGNNYSKYMTFFTNPSGSAATERLRIGTSGEIGIGGANYGTSGQVLTSGGSGAAASWADAGGGAWEVISTQALSSSYTTGYVENTGWSNSYARYAMTFDGIANSSNFKIWIQIYADNTSGNTGTLITSSDYHSGAWRTKIGNANSGGVVGFQYSNSYAPQHLLANNTGYSEYTAGEFIFPMNNRNSGAPNALKRWSGRHIAYSEEFLQDSGYVSEASYHTTGVRISFYNTSNNAYVTPTDGRVTFLRMKYS